MQSYITDIILSTCDMDGALMEKKPCVSRNLKKRKYGLLEIMVIFPVFPKYLGHAVF